MSTDINATRPASGQRPATVPAPTAVTWTGDEDSTVVIDVRTPGEFEAVHIAGSYNVPLDLLGEHAQQFASRLNQGRHVLLVCQSGARATQAQRRLSERGLEQVSVLQGGVQAFEAAGGAVVRGKGRWAMDRQVRMVAGSIVLSSILASVVAPKTRFVAGAIGAGLTYSAVSNSCAMAAVLGKLPYNRGTTNPTVTSVLQSLPSTH
jgi:rhodanese-related sulfurtransferase